MELEKETSRDGASFAGSLTQVEPLRLSESGNPACSSRKPPPVCLEGRMFMSTLIVFVVVVFTNDI